VFANGKNHINGIENFWNQAKRVLRKYNGIPKNHFRYSSRNASSDSTTEQQLKLLKEWAEIWGLSTSAPKRNHLNRLPQNQRKRSIPTVKRYEKQVPGQHVQIDVKFLFFKDNAGKRVKRFQYTAIDDATRIRALKIYDRHNQQNTIDFLDYVIDKFPFRIHTVQTDNGH